MDKVPAKSGADMHQENNQRSFTNTYSEVTTAGNLFSKSAENKLADDQPFPQTRSRHMREFIEAAKRAAVTNAPILLSGESGTGKTFFAREIHRWSGRDDRTFVTVDSADLAEQSACSEKVSAVLNSLTSPSENTGVPESTGFTLFLDNATDLDPAGQSAVLRFIEEEKSRALDPRLVSQMHFRIIATSRLDLATKVAAGLFRHDLFYRLSVIALQVPPLRERREDIGPIAAHLLKQERLRSGRPSLRYSRAAMSAFQRYNWPGNLSELRKMTESIALKASTNLIELDDLPGTLSAAARYSPSSKNTSLEEVERRHIRQILEQSLTMEDAATALGINTTTLWRKRKLYNLR
jgi:NtrC-family two-component system response regulator AlgB